MQPSLSTPKTFNAKGTRFLIVEGRFYDRINDELVAGASEALRDAGAEYDVITLPGALEIPAAMAICLDMAAAQGNSYSGAIALGCVIRGDTGHYDIVAGESSRGLMDLSIQRKLPLGNGILTVENEAQALERANRHQMNRGRGAAEAALSLHALLL